MYMCWYLGSWILVNIVTGLVDILAGVLLRVVAQGLGKFSG